MNLAINRCIMIPVRAMQGKILEIAKERRHELAKATDEGFQPKTGCNINYCILTDETGNERARKVRNQCDLFGYPLLYQIYWYGVR